MKNDILEKIPEGTTAIIVLPKNYAYDISNFKGKIITIMDYEEVHQVYRFKYIGHNIISPYRIIRTAFDIIYLPENYKEEFVDILDI